MKDKFIAINLIENEDKLLNKYPIIYFWDGNGEIEDAVKTEEFINATKRLINKENYWTLSANLIYVYEDEENENQYINKEIKISEIIDLSQDLYKEYIIEVLDFLYFCVFKKHSNNQDILTLYKEIKNKYPKKVTCDVVSKYIKSRTSENYPEIPENVLNKIENIFLNIINDEL